MKTKLLKKVKKALKDFSVSVTKISKHGYIEVMALETYNGEYTFYGNEQRFYNRDDFEEWKKERHFIFYKSCIDYYRGRYNLISSKDKKILEKFGL